MSQIRVVTSTLKGKNKDGTARTTDGADHQLSRLLPFMTKADFEKAPGKALDAWLKELAEFDASRTLDGVDETGASVKKQGLPYKSFGTDTAASAGEVFETIWRGLSLAHQPELAAKLSKKWEPEGAAAAKKGRTPRAAANAAEIG